VAETRDRDSRPRLATEAARTTEVQRARGDYFQLNGSRGHCDVQATFHSISMATMSEEELDGCQERDAARRNEGSLSLVELPVEVSCPLIL
jgi:hypothetical protein